MSVVPVLGIAVSSLAAVATVVVVVAMAWRSAVREGSVVPEEPDVSPGKEAMGGQAVGFIPAHLARVVRGAFPMASPGRMEYRAKVRLGMEDPTELAAQSGAFVAHRFMSTTDSLFTIRTASAVP